MVPQQITARHNLMLVQIGILQLLFSVFSCICLLTFLAVLSDEYPYLVQQRSLVAAETSRIRLELDGP